MKRPLLINLLLISPLFLIGQVDLIGLEILPKSLQDSIYKRESTIIEDLPPSIKELVSSSVVKKSRIWNEGVLKVSFKGGDSKLHKAIAETASTWTKYGDITFDFGYNPFDGTFRKWTRRDSSHIRVGFSLPGNWSLIGNQSIDWRAIPKGYVSLNLHEFDKELPWDWKETVLHEFGHALGFMHEHQSPEIDCDFDWPKVYKELAKKPNEWSKQQVDHNMRKLTQSDLISSRFDKRSIMLYSFPPWMYKTGKKSECYTEPNIKLSAQDKKKMNEIYPLKKSDYVALRKEISVAYDEIIEAYKKEDSTDSSSNYVTYEIFKNTAEYFSKDRIENSRYIIGLQGLKVDEKKYDKFSEHIRDQGYNVNLSSNYHEKRPWLAETSLVLYYTSKNKSKAQEIAIELYKVTGEEFGIARGKGLAVFDPSKQFYIHWIPDN